MTLDERIIELEKRKAYSESKGHKALGLQQGIDWLKELRDLKAMRVNQMSEENLACLISVSACSITCKNCPIECSSRYLIEKNCSLQVVKYLLSAPEKEEKK